MSTQAEKIAEAVGKPRKVALYLNMEYSGFCIHEVHYANHDEHYEPLPEGQLRELPFLDGYVRVTEPIELSFKSTSQDEILSRAVESLNETERKTMVEFEQKLADIREKRNQLLAITHQPVAEAL